MAYVKGWLAAGVLAGLWAGVLPGGRSSGHTTVVPIHGGAPVTEGEKWIATKWLREREFK